MDDPESLLNAWLQELDSLSVNQIGPNDGSENWRQKGLENGVALRSTQMTSDLNTPRIDSYRFSMANLEETLDADLDAILGELCALENKCDEEIAGARNLKRESRQETPRSRLDTSDDHGGGIKDTMGRTDSPDNDSAFSDNVSLLSSESSASSGGSSGASKTSSGLGIDPHLQHETAHRAKAEKIRIALEKMKQASVQKLFIKAFTSDGSTKSLLVDEKMSCSFVTRLLADKNHVSMEPKWGLVEHLPDLYMERVYEDHELLVENLMLWTRDSPNTLLFHERPDKYQLFHTPEAFLLTGDELSLDPDQEQDSHSRAILLDEFFSHTRVPEISGPLYLKTDSRKCWKRYQFVLRGSGLYYYPKEKPKSFRDLACLASFDNNQVYYGVGWRKKFKSPTEFCFAIKHPRLQQSKSSKYIKYLCAEDNATLQKWVVGIRIAKYGRQLLDNYRALLDDMAQEDLDQLAHARSCSTASIAQVAAETRDSFLVNEELAIHRRDSVVSRASSSSSSGCHSDGVSGSETGFLCDYPSGTIKRKPPTIQPKIPLTSMTRQLIEVGENMEGGTLTRRASWRRSTTVEDGQSTLTRGRSMRASDETGCQSTLTRGRSMRANEEPGNQSTLTRGRSLRASLANEEAGSSSTLTRARSMRSSDESQSTLTRRMSAKKTEEETARLRGLNDPTCVLNEASRTLNEAMNSLLAQTGNIEPNLPAPPPPTVVDSHFEEALERDLEAISDNSSSFGEDEEKDDDEDLPPPPEMFDSTLSLDSLPPPPSQSELPVFDSELSCSSLSLASLPPFPRAVSPKSDLSTPVSSGEATPTNGTPTRQKASRAFDFQSGTVTPTNGSLTRGQSFRTESPRSGEATPTNGSLTRTGRVDLRTPPTGQSASTTPTNSPLSRGPSLRSFATDGAPRSPPIVQAYGGVKAPYYPPTAAANGVNVVVKASPPPPRVSFLPQSPRLPPSGPRRVTFAASPPTPPTPTKLSPPANEFLKDLQRVMRKKWQVAQKCAAEPTVTPHEVLGFRDPPQSKEAHVSNWVNQHYGLYENVFSQNGVDGMAGPPVAASVTTQPQQPIKKRPPPPPPKRSETTHLTTRMY